MPSALEMLQAEYEGIDAERRAAEQERRGVLSMMHDKILNSEAARMSPEVAGFMGAAAGFRTPTGAYGGALGARQAQAAVRDKAALGAMPEFNTMLSESGKHLSDLQKAALARISTKENNASNRYYVAGTAADGLILVDKETGKTSLQTIPSRFFSQMADSEQKWIEILSKEGGDPAEIQKEAKNRAGQEIAGYMGFHQFGDLNRGNFQSPVDTGRAIGTTPALERPETDISAPISSVKEPLRMQTYNDVERAFAEGRIDKSEFDAIAGEFKKAGVKFEGTNTIPGSTMESPAISKQPSITIRTPQQRATETELGQLHAKENAADRESLASMQNLERSRAVMADIINSGTHTSSPMHEFLSGAGGFMSLIDPNGSLAKAAGNDQMYYANLMNLVRDKIKALGSGTAVSNLDLIVTQKSVGDLRNTADGNKKLLAIMELQNATMMSKMGNKLNYFDQAKTYDEYRGDASATHILRRSPKTGEYWTQSKEDWINEQVKAGVVRDSEEAAKFFEQEARNATKRMIKGTSLDPDYYKKK